MKMTTLLMLLISVSLYGQSERKTVMLFFDSDSWLLKKEEIIKIENHLANEKHIDSIELSGHTDSRGSEKYNLHLSERRVLETKKFLIQKGIESQLIITDFLGENTPIATNESYEGRLKNRRVELIIYFSGKTIDENDEIISQQNYISNGSLKKDSSDILIQKFANLDVQNKEKDTILVIDNVQIVVSTSDYYKYKDCLQIKPILDGEAALKNGLTTMSVGDEALISCGMIDIKLTELCTGCFDNPIKIRFPVKDKNCDVCRFPSVFNISNNGRWNLTDDKVKKLTINGILYKEITIKCPSMMNCDCKQEAKKVKVKIPRGYKLLNLNIFYNCPIANYEFKVKKNTAKGALPCILVDREAFVVLEVFKYEGEIVKLIEIPLNELTHSPFKKCKSSPLRSKWPIFKNWKYKFYSKYKLKTQNLN